MEKIILVSYSEKNDWEAENWYRYKCLPYTQADHDRVKKYVNALHKFLTDENCNYYDYYDVDYDVVGGDAVTIDQYLKELSTSDGFNKYKEEATVKIYKNGEKLPHEVDLETGRELTLYKHFGEHSDYKCECNTGIIIKLSKNEKNIEKSPKILFSK